jgi:hypothetical protein
MKTPCELRHEGVLKRSAGRSAPAFGAEMLRRGIGQLDEPPVAMSVTAWYSITS